MMVAHLNHVMEKVVNFFLMIFVSKCTTEEGKKKHASLNPEVGIVTAHPGV